MVSWFSENMTGAEVVTISPLGYANKGICMQWLDHFIQHNDYGPNKLEDPFTRRRYVSRSRRFHY
jgi:hypothetical protein